MSGCDDKSLTNQSSNQVDGIVDNLTVTNSLVLSNPLTIPYGGTGLSTVGTIGQVLTSTGSGLTYTTPGSGGGGVSAVTASTPLVSSGGPTPNISINATTGTGAVVLATSPTISNLTVSNSLVLANSLPVIYGGTGLSAVGAVGQVLTSTGSGLVYTTPTGGVGTVTTVTATPPLVSTGGATPNISCISTTGSGSVVLATTPTITAPLTVSSATSPAQTVVTDVSPVGIGSVRTSSDAFGLDIAAGGFGLGNLKRVRLLADTVTITNSSSTLGADNFFNVAIPTNITTSFCSDILSFTNSGNTSNNSTQGLSMYTFGSPNSPRLNMGIRSGVNYPSTKNTYFEIIDTQATFNVSSGTGLSSFTSTTGGFTVSSSSGFIRFTGSGSSSIIKSCTGSGSINNTCTSTGSMTTSCTGSGSITISTASNRIRIQAGATLELSSTVATTLSASSFIVTAPTTITGAVGINGATTITGITAITGATTITGAATIIGLTTTDALTVIGVSTLTGAVGIAGLLGVAGSANFTGTNLTANVAGNVSLTGVLNANLVSGSGAVKIAADLGGVSIGGNGYGSAGNFQVNTKSGSGAFQTGSVTFLIEKTSTETGPGNFSVDTLGAATGDYIVAAKGSVSLKSNASGQSIQLNTSFITPSTYSWSYPATAGTLNSILLSGAGSGPMTWLGPGVNNTVLTSNGTSLSWQPVSSTTVDWSTPGTIGSNIRNTGAFTTLSAFASNSASTEGVLNITNTFNSSSSVATFLSPNLGDTEATNLILGKGFGINESVYLNYNYNSDPQLVSSTWGFINNNPPQFISLKGDQSIVFNSATALFTGQIVSQIGTGTAPLSVTSTTVVPNLNVSQLLGSTWAAAGAIGDSVRNTGAFTTLSAFASNSASTEGVFNITNTFNSSSSVATFLSPNLGDTEATNLILGKGFGINESVYLNYNYNSNPQLVSSTWGFINNNPPQFISLNGNGSIVFNSATAVFTGQIVSQIGTGTAPLSVTSTTVVPNLNVSQLLGFTWEAAGAIGNLVRNTGAFTTLSAFASNSSLSEGIINVVNTFNLSSSIATFISPNLGNNEDTNIVFGKGFGGNESAYINFKNNSLTPSLISSTWGFSNNTPATSIQLRGDGGIKFFNGNSVITMNPAFVSPSQTLCVDASKNIISRIGGSNTFYGNFDTTTGVANDTWTTIAAPQVIRQKGNGTLSYEDEFYKNQSGQGLLVTISFSAIRQNNAFGYSAARIVLNNNLVIQNQDGSANDRISVSASTYLDPGETISAQFFQNSGVGLNIVDVKLTISTYPLSD